MDGAHAAFRPLALPTSAFVASHSYPLIPVYPGGVTIATAPSTTSGVPGQCPGARGADRQRPAARRASAPH